MVYILFNRPSLSVVIPCFNEADGLGELHRRLTAICHKFAGSDWEAVLVDDGSTDGTGAIIRSFVQSSPQFVGVLLSRNHGHQLALTAGLSQARGERILIIDADLQDPPELLPDMMALMDQGHEVVYGQRISRRGETAFKKGSAALFYRLLNRLTDTNIPVDTGDFRLMSRRALDVLMSMPEQHRFIRGMVSWIGFSQAPLLYDRDERFAGETKYPLSKMLTLTVDALTSFSTKPLRLATWLGMFVASLSIPLFIYIFASWIVGQTVSGWVSLTLIVVFLGSTQLIVLGIIGEYVGRMYMQSKGRPLFILEDVCRYSEVDDDQAEKPMLTEKIKHADRI
jgi:glycosyltransferase involved in cell wall biosynthesis